MNAPGCWKEDLILKSNLEDYVLRNLKRSEIIDYVKRDHSEYAWSLPTLSRRLSYFGIKYIDYKISVDNVIDCVQKEMDGPGKLLGYRLMHKKIRENHKQAVPRQLVYDVMTANHYDVLRGRALVPKCKRRGPVGTFSSLGPNHTYSADGHDKLMGYQRNMFPFAIYGMQDVYSSKLLFVKVSTSNKNPKLIGKWYLDYINQTRVIGQNLRLDKGSENGLIATIHAFLRSNETENSEESVIFGSSTSNKIERWWRELHFRFGKYFKEKFRYLFEEGYYNPEEKIDRDILALVFLPLLQEEIDEFCNLWNNHRMRKQNTDQPKGIPNHLYDFPEKYGSTNCGTEVTEDDLENLNTLADVADVDGNMVDTDLERRCRDLLPNLDDIKLTDASEAYLYLKAAL